MITKNEVLAGKKYPTDLILSGIFSIIAAVSAFLLPDGNILRVILGIPIILFFPGYALVSALWPKFMVNNLDDDSQQKKTQNPDIFERFVLSLGISICISAIIGIILSFIWIISLTSIVISLICFIFIFLCIAWYRRMKVLENERFVLSLMFDFKMNMSNFSIAEKTIVVSLSVAIIISSLFLIQMISVPHIEEFSELYVLDQNSTIDDFPVNMTVNETRSIFIGVTCYEHETTNYSIVVTLEDTNGVIDNSTLFINNFTLDHEENNEIPFSFQINQTGEYKLLIELSKEDSSIPYLENHLWIRVS